jgi:hypothetical protein
MAFEILENERNSQPLETMLLESVSYGESGRKEKTKVILVPRPSDSPKDPLNMSRRRKEILFATIILGACATGAPWPFAYSWIQHHRGGFPPGRFDEDHSVE